MDEIKILAETLAARKKVIETYIDGQDATKELKEYSIDNLKGRRDEIIFILEILKKYY
jgi:hypothetical protein